jgi:ADP-ribose pyrophosphatase
MAKTSIVSTKQLTDCKWLNMYETTYKRQGHEGRWVFCSRKPPGKLSPTRRKPDAVMIVPTLIEDGVRRLVFLKEYRVALRTFEYHFPAGLIEDEDAVETARRELKEETGFHLTNVKHVSPRLFTTSGLTDESVVMVFAECQIGDGKQELEPNEQIEVLLLDYDGVCKMLKSNEPMDAKSWPILMMIQQQGKI